MYSKYHTSAQDNIFAATIEQAFIDLQLVTENDFKKAHNKAEQNRRASRRKDAVDAYDFIFSERLDEWVLVTGLNLDADWLRQGVAKKLSRKRRIFALLEKRRILCKQ